MFSDTDRLIHQANILLPDGHFFLGDIQSRQGKIARIAEDIAPETTDDVLDAKGLTMFPGVIDPQVHKTINHHTPIQRLLNS